MEPNLALTTSQSPIITEEMRRQSYINYLQNKSIEHPKGPLSVLTSTPTIAGAVSGSLIMPGIGSLIGGIIGAGIANSAREEENAEIAKAQWIMNQPRLQAAIAPTQVQAPIHNPVTMRQIISSAQK